MDFLWLCLKSGLLVPCVLGSAALQNQKKLASPLGYVRTCVSQDH